MEHASLAGPRPAAIRRRRALTLAALAAWAIAVPWVARAVGLALDVPTRLEVIDHVVPGVVVLACCAALARASEPSALPALGAAALACLAGFWITATHAPLLPEAIDGISSWGAALLHLSAGPPITLYALWMLLSDAGG